MKKFALTNLSFVLLVIVNKAYAAPGDMAGNIIYSTDIVAYIDGLAAESYNIGGKTVVIAEALEPYGFEVIWDAESRTISVYTKRLPETVPEYIPEDNIRNVVHTNASTIGACYNMLITLSDDLIINGVASDTETADLVLYSGEIYIGINAINSALGKRAVSYKYELPENCTEHIDDVRESHVVVYINDNHINSFNTSDGSCYVSAKDLKEHGFKVEIDGYTCNILSPEKAVTLEQETEYPETREYGDVDETLTLYPIYNGVYDVTIDGKTIEDVYIMTTLIYRSPCISVQELASIAGYKTDTSDPFKVKIYTE